MNPQPDTPAVNRMSPPHTALSEGSLSDEEEWHDAPDKSETDAYAAVASSGSPTPLDPVKREQALKVSCLLICKV